MKWKEGSGVGLFNRKPVVSIAIVEAADRGDKRAQERLQRAFELGLSADEHNELRRKAYCIKAEEGDPFAQYWMGFLSSMIDRDPVRTLYWLERAANQGNVDAMLHLKLCYSEFLNETDLGYGPVPLGYDAKKELYWLKKAAELGDTKSIAELRSLGY